MFIPFKFIVNRQSIIIRGKIGFSASFLQIFCIISTTANKV